MKALTFLSITTFLLSAQCFASDMPEPVKVYCFSADLEAGFKDKGAVYFCGQLNKRGTKKGSLSVVDSKDDAFITVNYLGRKSITKQGEATYFVGRYAWTPEQMQDGIRAVVAVGDFTKGFYAEGINDVPLSSVKDQIEAWIRDNRETIMKKAHEK